MIDLFLLVEDGKLREDEARALLLSGRWPCRNVTQNLADLKAQVAANETGRRELLRAVEGMGLATVEAYMGHVQANAEECVRAVIGGLKDGSFIYPMDIGTEIRVKVTVDPVGRAATVDFTGTSPQHAGNYNAPKAIAKAVVLYVFRTLVGKDIPLNEGCLRPLTIILPEGTMLNPRYPAAVIAGNTEVSQAACNALYGALGVLAAGQGTMNNFVWGNERFQNYETIAGGAGAGPGFCWLRRGAKPYDQHPHDRPRGAGTPLPGAAGTVWHPRWFGWRGPVARRAWGGATDAVSGAGDCHHPVIITQDRALWGGRRRGRGAGAEPGLLAGWALRGAGGQ